LRRIQALLKTSTNVILVRENSSAKTAMSTFDYSDLNGYLLLVLGLLKPEEDQMPTFNDIAVSAQQGKQITLRDIQPICRKETLVNLTADANLSQAIEVLGSGIHQLLVIDDSGNVSGIITQLQVVEFFWNEAVNFPTIDRLYAIILRDLGVGSQQIISVK
jgi:predicted transcriptional regulator